VSDNKSPKPGWRQVKFGDVVQLSKARSQDPLAEGIERYVGLEHLEPGDLRIRSWGNVADGVTFNSVFKAGQVLFGKRRAYQRKVAVAEFSGVCSGDIYVLETKDSRVLLPELLPFICQTDAFFDHAVGTSAGSLSPRTNWTSLSDFVFVLPPTEEQQRILNLLRATSEAVETFVQTLRCHERVRRAALDDLLMGNRWTSEADSALPTGWSSRPLGSVCELVNGFGFKPQDWRESGLPIIRIQNLNGSTQFNYFSGDVDPKFHVNNGDLLFAWAGVPGVSFGARIWKGQEAVLNQHIFRVVPRDGVNESWLFEILNHMTPAIERRAHGFKTSLLHIKRSELVKMPVKVPPAHVQKEIAELSVELTRSWQALDDRLLALKELNRLTLTWTGGQV
jgi:type I restriction enzyme S subunit